MTFRTHTDHELAMYLYSHPGDADAIAEAIIRFIEAHTEESARYRT